MNKNDEQPADRRPLPSDCVVDRRRLLPSESHASNHTLRYPREHGPIARWNRGVSSARGRIRAPSLAAIIANRQGAYWTQVDEADADSDRLVSAEASSADADCAPGKLPAVSSPTANSAPGPSRQFTSDRPAAASWHRRVVRWRLRPNCPRARCRFGLCATVFSIQIADAVVYSKRRCYGATPATDVRPTRGDAATIIKPLRIAATRRIARAKLRPRL
jgi:hypothetical protein